MNGDHHGINLKQHVLDLLKRLDYAHELLSGCGVVKLSSFKLARLDSNWMLLARVGINLQDNESPTKVRCVHLDNCLACRIEVQENRCMGEETFKLLKGVFL